MRIAVGIARTWSVLVAAAVLVSACGTSVPSLNEAWEVAEINDDLAYRIKKSIYCELRLAVLTEGTKTSGYRSRPVDAIPDNWGSQVTITLKVDETGGSNIGATTNSPVLDGTFGFSLAGSVSTQAVRTDTYYTYFNLFALKKDWDPSETTCAVDRKGFSPLLSGNLGIQRWLKGALDAQTGIPSSPAPQNLASKLDVLQYQVQFVVITSGNVNPVFRLVDVSANTAGGPFLQGSRTRTHTLLLTMGPTVIVEEVPRRSGRPARTSSAPSRAAADVHFSSQIGQAVASGIRDALRQ